MMRKFTMAFHVPGTLSADLSIIWTAPAGAQLVHVSAVGSNANNGLITIGTTSDADAYLESASIGVSDVPVEFELADFVGDQYPVIADGDVCTIVLDHDGAGGTATDDFTVVLTLLEGGV
jgi:hypothetical protein